MMKNNFLGFLFVSVVLIISISELSAQSEIFALRFPNSSSQSIKKAKILLKNNKSERGYIYNIDSTYVYIVHSKKQFDRALNSKCEDCLKIPVSLIDEISFKKLGPLGEISNVLAGVVLTAGVAGAIASESEYSAYLLVFAGAPAGGVLLINTIIASARNQKRTITIKEIERNDFNDSKVFFVEYHRKALLEKQISYIRKLNLRLTTNPKGELIPFIISDITNKSHVGYFVKLDKDIIYLTPNKSLAIQLRKERADTEVSVRLEDIVYIEKISER